jgi:riboflavin kinase
MKVYLINTLKEIALLGGIKGRIEISSSQLAKRLGTSQQTASRYLLQLDKNGLIDRKMGLKKQLIKITSLGEDILHKEYTQYRHIFEMKNEIHFKGKIVSGMGEGRYYTIKEGYISQFREKLGFTPYPGTLNVKIEDVEINKLKQLKSHPGIVLEEFEAEDRTFGSVKCFSAKINNKDIECAVVLPARGHYSNIIEIVSPHYLREKVGLEDGDEIELTIRLK